jgi:hypothetical protein
MNTNAPDAKNGDGTTSQTHIRATDGGRGYRDAETLRRLYHDEGLSTADIAERFDVGRSTTTRWLEKHGIERRNPAEASWMNRGPDDVVVPPESALRERIGGDINDADALRELYCERTCPASRRQSESETDH